jgi:hypothetical protein
LSNGSSNTSEINLLLLEDQISDKSNNSQTPNEINLSHEVAKFKDLKKDNSGSFSNNELSISKEDKYIHRDVLNMLNSSMVNIFNILPISL